MSRDVKIRWTPDLVEEGFTPVSTFFLDNYAALGMTSAEVVLVLHLIRFKWDHRNPYPSFEVLAGRSGIGYNGVRAQARSLEAKGFLKRVRRRGYVEFDLTPLFRKFEAYRQEKRAA